MGYSQVCLASRFFKLCYKINAVGRFSNGFHLVVVNLHFEFIYTS